MFLNLACLFVSGAEVDLKNARPVQDGSARLASCCRQLWSPGPAATFQWGGFVNSVCQLSGRRLFKWSCLQWARMIYDLASRNRRSFNIR